MGELSVWEKVGWLGRNKNTIIIQPLVLDFQSRYPSHRINIESLFSPHVLLKH